MKANDKPALPGLNRWKFNGLLACTTALVSLITGSRRSTKRAKVTSADQI